MDFEDEWLRGLEPENRRELKLLLRELKSALESALEPGPVLISDTGPTEGDFILPHDQMQRLREDRAHRLALLAKKGIVLPPVHGAAHGVFRVNAELKTVQRALGALESAPASGSPTTPQQPQTSKASTDGASELAKAEDFSLNWLLHKVPVRAWVWVAGLLLAAFLGGVSFGRSPLVQDRPEGRRISRADIQAQLDQLIAGHNAVIAKLYDEIANQEKGAGATFGIVEQGPHVEAAQRLRDAVAREDSSFRAQVKLLTDLSR
jgi:hypothetical protein